MLILTRKKDEVICVGNDVKIVVVEIRPGSVRIGIEAPREVPVDREEVFLDKIRSKQHAQAE